MSLRAAFEAWVLSLDMSCLTDGECELLHSLRTVAQWEAIRAWRHGR